MRRKVLYNPGSSFYPYAFRVTGLGVKIRNIFLRPFPQPLAFPDISSLARPPHLKVPIAHRGGKKGEEGFSVVPLPSEFRRRGTPDLEPISQPERADGVERWRKPPAGSPFESDGAGLARRTLGAGGSDATARRVRVLTGCEEGAGRSAFARAPIEMPICGVPGTCDIARGQQLLLVSAPNLGCRHGRPGLRQWELLLVSRPGAHDRAKFAKSRPPRSRRQDCARMVVRFHDATMRLDCRQGVAIVGTPLGDLQGCRKGGI